MEKKEEEEMFGSKDLKSEIHSIARSAANNANKSIRIGPWELYATPEGYLAALNVDTMEEVLLAITSTPVGTLPVPNEDL